MVKNKAMKILFIISLLQIVASCKEKGTEPPLTKPFKNPREMTWTADTLKMPDYAIQLLPLDLLVVSPEDIWLAAWVGHGQVYHYDGKTWNMVKEIGGGINCLVQGSTPNSIWVGGYIGRDVDGQFTQNAYLGYYNGANWQDNEFQLKSELLDMSTDPSGNIWACGRNGLVFKYENNKWTTDTINLNLNDNVAYWLKSIENFNGKTYILAPTAHKTTYLEKYYFLSGDMDNFIVLDSMIFDSPSVTIKWGYLQLYSSTFNKLYSNGLSGVWIYQDKDWEKILDVNGTIYNIYGKAENFLLAVGDYDKVLFYNGSTWMSIADLFKVNDPTFVFKNVWTDGYEIIITGYGAVNNKRGTIIWHGK